MALPFYVIGVYAGFRNMLRVWPVLLVSGGSFALTQFVTSNFINYSLTDVLSSLVSLILTIAFLRVWRPAADPAFAINVDRVNETRGKITGTQGWYPWLIVSAVVIIWTIAKIFLIGDVKVPWPGLDKAVFITLYNTPYGAIWDFQAFQNAVDVMAGRKSVSEKKLLTNEELEAPRKLHEVDIEVIDPAHEQQALLVALRDAGLQARGYQMFGRYGVDAEVPTPIPPRLAAILNSYGLRAADGQLRVEFVVSKTQ